MYFLLFIFPPLRPNIERPSVGLRPVNINEGYVPPWLVDLGLKPHSILLVKFPPPALHHALDIDDRIQLRDYIFSRSLKWFIALNLQLYVQTVHVCVCVCDIDLYGGGQITNNATQDNPSGHIFQSFSYNHLTAFLLDFFCRLICVKKLIDSVTAVTLVCACAVCVLRCVFSSTSRPLRKYIGTDLIICFDLTISADLSSSQLSNFS